MNMFSVRNIIFWYSLVSGVLFSTDLEDFSKDWVGYESLSSPSLNYQGRQIYLDVRGNADEMESLVYASNSEFIYNGYLDWAGHFLTYDKDLNYISFGRRFYTPLGIIGTQQLDYKILEFDENRLTLEHTSADSSTTHTMIISAIALSLVNDYMPQSVSIQANYPNPFNPTTKIDFTLPRSDDVNVTIYNLVGQQIKVLVNSNLEYGYHTVTWNGLDQLGRPVASGVYFSELRTRNFRQTKKMLLLK